AGGAGARGPGLQRSPWLSHGRLSRRRNRPAACPDDLQRPPRRHIRERPFRVRLPLLIWPWGVQPILERGSARGFQHPFLLCPVRIIRYPFHRAGPTVATTTDIVTHVRTR